VAEFKVLSRHLPLGTKDNNEEPQSGRVGFEVLTAVSTKMAVFWVIALMMEAARTSETLVNFYQTTRSYNPEDSHLRQSG
jgi:hypothetical protein